MNTEFVLDLRDRDEVRIWRSADGKIQLSVHDMFEGTALGLTADQARSIALALNSAADEAEP